MRTLLATAGPQSFQDQPLCGRLTGDEEMMVLSQFFVEQCWTVMPVLFTVQAQRFRPEFCSVCLARLPAAKPMAQTAVSISAVALQWLIQLPFTQLKALCCLGNSKFILFDEENHFKSFDLDNIQC
jgi:hypothetical protein